MQDLMAFGKPMCLQMKSTSSTSSTASTTHTCMANTGHNALHHLALERLAWAQSSLPALSNPRSGRAACVREGPLQPERGANALLLPIRDSTKSPAL
jgi:hypothetical protein